MRDVILAQLAAARAVLALAQEEGASPSMVAAGLASLDAASGLINPGKAGQVRLIGVAAERRLPMLPDVPTFIEQGIAGFTGSTWAGLLAPARTPPAIIKRVSDEVAKIVRLDDVKTRLEGMGTLPAGSTPEEFAAFIDAETAKWGKVIREAKVKLD